SKGLAAMSEQYQFQSVRKNIKLELFDFNDDYDNEQIQEYVTKKLDKLGYKNRSKLITYGDMIKFIKIEVSSYEDVVKIASINGVKSVDFFQEYSLPLGEYIKNGLKTYIDEDGIDSDEIIGIIDGGISYNNPLLAPYIIAKEEYVSEEYRNDNHATFIASTIQYGNKLNGIDADNQKRFKFIDIIAIPNDDERFGPIDSICEDELMEIIEEVMEKYAEKVKIWNISLGLKAKVSNDSMSTLGKFMDYIQEKYEVQLFISSGNLNELPLRQWPSQVDMGERDRIISPADSVRAITVGSIALYDSNDSIVKKNEPSPFSRRGPGANYIVKPDVVDYGGNMSKDYRIAGLAMKGLDINGNIVEGNGTSYSNPRVVQKFASIYDEMVDKDLLLAKAMLIHSARMSSRDLIDKNPDNIKYYGFGMPSVNINDILRCSADEVTLVFKQRVIQGSHLEMYDFPFPKSLIRNNKYFGEICMTLVYDPIVDSRYGKEYCRTNIDVSFGTYKVLDGKIKFTGKVPLEVSWDEMNEEYRVKNGFKWSPIKSYYRNFKKGISVEDGWKIRIDMRPRNGLEVSSQEFVLIVTIKDPNGNDIYSEIINGLRERGYITNNLEIKQQIRQRQ
ncbi:MAG: S8 family peptidase, partial [Clostridium sp.]